MADDPIGDFVPVRQSLVHRMAKMKAAMIAGLREKTGKSLEEWLGVVRASGLSKHKETVTLPKGGHWLAAAGLEENHGVVRVWDARPLDQ